MLLAASQLFCVGGGVWLLVQRAKGVADNGLVVGWVQDNAEVLGMVALGSFNAVPSLALLLLPLGRAMGTVSIISVVSMLVCLAGVGVMGAVMMMVPWAGRGDTAGG